MRIVDVCAFYAPAGGGVRTYVDAKLRAAASFGHEIIVLAPGEYRHVEQRGPGALLVTLPSPKLPVDQRYRYFNDQTALHQALDLWRPDHVEASSPWSSATMVGRWQGAATRSLVMHADPMAAYAYRWFGGIARTETIDRWFGRFWRHLRGLGDMFDAVVCANSHLAERLRLGGLDNAETIPMGVERGIFSPRLRSSDVRATALESVGLGPEGTLLVGVGRFSGEKRWETVIRSIGTSARRHPIGLVLVGDGPRRRKLVALAERSAAVTVLPRLSDRNELARLLASADALVHGCEAETFCLVAAEARASGIPLIVPDRGAAVDQMLSKVGALYRAGSGRSLGRAIERFIDRGPELQRAAAARSSQVRSMDEHFAELFGRYEMLTRRRAIQPLPDVAAYAAAGPLPELALARSAMPIR